MVKNHSESERGNLLHHPTDRITHTTAFVTSVVEHWLGKQANALFDNALNIFYLQLHGMEHMVKDHSDND